MAEPAVPKNIRRSPLLRFNDDGTVRLRFGWAFWVQAVGVAYMVPALLYLNYTNDSWLGPPLILGGFAALIVWQVFHLRRHLRVARTPGKRFQLSLIDGFLVTTAAVIFFAGYSINDRQRSAELTRRAEIQRDALSIMGPNGKLERDHRARVWLTVGDPTFDDSRLATLLGLLEYDQRRYGITRLGFQVAPGTAAQFARTRLQLLAGSHGSLGGSDNTPPFNPGLVALGNGHLIPWSSRANRVA